MHVGSTFASSAAVATNGAGFLTAWTTGYSPSQASAVMLTPADAAGNALPSVAYPTATGVNLLAVIAVRGEYLVAWSDNFKLHLLRVAPPATVRGETTLPKLLIGSIFTDGDRIFVLTSQPAERKFQLFTIDAAGTILSSREYRLTNGFGVGRIVATAGDDLLVLAGAYSISTFLHRLSPDGGVRTKDLPIYWRTSISALWNGSAPVVAAVETDGTLQAGIIDADDSISSAHQVVSHPLFVDRAQIIRVGGRFVAVFDARANPKDPQSRPSVYAQAMNDDTSPSGAPLLLAPGQLATATGSDRDAMVVASGNTLQAIRLEFDQGALADRTMTTISNIPAPQSPIGVVSDGASFLALYAENALSGSTANAARLDLVGDVDAPAELSSSGPFGVISQHALAFGGGVAVAVSSDYHNVFIRRFTRDGALLDAQPIAVKSEVHPDALPIVASDGRDFLVAWGDMSGTVMGIVVRPDGTISEPRVLSRSTGIRLSYAVPQLVWDGRQYALIAERTFHTGDPHDYDLGAQIEAMRVGADGSPIDAAPIVLDYPRGLLAIATDGREVFLVGRRGSDLVFGRAIVDAHPHIVQQPTRIFSWFGSIAPAVMWNGGSYLLAWRYDAGTDISFLACTHVDSDGSFDAPRVIAAGAATGPPLLAVNSLGTEVLMMQEVRDGASRAVVYTAGEINGAVPAAPRPPLMIFARISAEQMLTAEWVPGSNDARGYFIEGFTGGWYPRADVPPDATRATLRASGKVRVTAWNEGGMASSNELRAIFERPRAASH